MDTRVSNRKYIIVCIDDEEILLESLSLELTDCLPEVELELLQDNTEAEELIQTLLQEGREIVIILCDYIMPVRKGDLVLASLHRLVPSARTIMLTGQTNLDGVTYAINHANLYRYIAKPWNHNDLILTLQGALESYTQEAMIQRQNHELKILNEQLEIKVAKRTQELQIANDNLNKAYHKINEYLQIIDQHVLICRIDKSGAITYTSQAFCHKSGYTNNELLGCNYWQLIYKNISSQQLQEILVNIETGKTWQGEMLHRTKNGKQYWVHEIISPNQQEESVILGFTSIHQDITEQKVVEEISITDALTGLYNRRHFDQIFERELSRARRMKQWLVFGIFDVDHFKLYNDNYGHAAGDEVLRRIGALLIERYKRGSDLVFRIGGEEFALLIIIHDQSDAQQYATGLVHAVAELALPHAYSAVAPWVTISLGMRIVDPTAARITPEILFQETDDLLYRAKRAGRNREYIE